jgi:hypothetical protein
VLAEESTVPSLMLQPIPPTLRKNLTGQRFERLLVLGYAYRNARSQTFWVCQCDCGKTHTVVSYALLKGDTRSCGCLNREVARARQRHDLTGQRFGRLLVESMVAQRGPSRAHCVCDCGTRTVVYAGNLTKANTTSCGCWHAEVVSAATRIDLTGLPFGRLLVESMTWKDGEGWAHCRCACGAAPSIRATKLATGHTQSCGCLQADAASQASRKDLTGQPFGRLVVESMTWEDGHGWAQCRCLCGTLHRVLGAALLSGNTQSCGCIKRRTPEEKRAVKRLGAHIRLARVRGAPYDFSRDDEIFMLDYWQNRCAICGSLPDFWHCLAWDHWLPLYHPQTLGTVPENLLPLCHSRKGAQHLGGVPACNNAKGARDPVAWLTERLGLRRAKAKLAQIAAYFQATRRLRA